MIVVCGWFGVFAPMLFLLIWWELGCLVADDFGCCFRCLLGCWCWGWFDVVCVVMVICWLGGFSVMWGGFVVVVSCCVCFVWWFGLGVCWF